MEHEAQLEWERRYAPRVAVAAFASAILAVAGFALYVNTLGNAHDSADLLVAVHKHKLAVVISSVITSLGVLLLIPVLVFLYRATAYRRPQIPRIALTLVIVAPVVAAIIGILTPILQIHAADQILKELPLPPSDAVDRANHFLRQGAAPVAAYAGIAASFGLAAGIALVSLNARRAGLLSGFMGVLGVILGVFFAIPIIIGPAVIQFFWLSAIGVLLLNRWPGERGPAWDTGEAIPWPSAAAQRARAQGEQTASQRDSETEIPTGTATATATHPRSKKRKRKRRN
jgi:hypothetical protein